MKKILNFIYGIFDMIKVFLFQWGLKILLVLFVGMVLHNLLKMAEISTRYTGEYKKLQIVDMENKKMMNIYSVGGGSKTILIMPGFGSQSPIIQYKALVDGLKDEYRVVVVEYLGYGFSMGTPKERTSENIVNEVLAGLNEAGISGPFVLMPHSLSNVYAMKMQQMHPELVQAIVSIDGTFPNEIAETYYYDLTKDTVTNIKITSILELTGFERVLSYVNPKVFYIDRMKNMTNVYSNDDIKVYRNRISSSYLTRTMVKEADSMISNMEDMKDYVYPEYLPVLTILSQETVDEYQENVNTNGAVRSLVEYAERTISNPAIQRIVTITGDHMLQLTNPAEVISNTKAFLGSY